MSNYYNEAGLKASIDKLTKYLKRAHLFSGIFNLCNVFFLLIIISAIEAIYNVYSYYYLSNSDGFDNGIFYLVALCSSMLFAFALSINHPFIDISIICYNSITRLVYSKKIDELVELIKTYCKHTIEKMDFDGVSLSDFLKTYEQMISAIDNIPDMSLKHNSLIFEGYSYVVKEDIYRYVKNEAVKVLLKYPEFKSVLTLRKASTYNLEIVHPDYRLLYRDRMYSPTFDAIRIILYRCMEPSDVLDDIVDGLNSYYESYEKSSKDDELIKQLAYDLRREFETAFIVPYATKRKKREQAFKNWEGSFTKDNNYETYESSGTDILAALTNISDITNSIGGKDISSDINTIINAVDYTSSHVLSLVDNK